MTKINNKIPLFVLFFAIAISLCLSAFAVVGIGVILTNTSVNKINTNLSHAYATCVYYNNKYKNGEMKLEEAQEMVLGIFRTYNEQTSPEYDFFIQDYKSNKTLLTSKRIIEAQSNIVKYNDEVKESFINQIFDETVTQGYSSANYVFKNPKDHKSYKRMVRTRVFKEWNWVIATGIYTNEYVRPITEFSLHMFVLFIIILVVISTLLLNCRVKSIKKMVESVPFPAFFKRLNGEYIYVNDKFAILGDYTPEELIGKTFYKDLITNTSEDILKEDDTNVYKTGSMVYCEKELVIHGRNLTFQIYKIPIFDFLGRVIGIAGLMKDVTEQRKLDKIKTDFMSVISHELKTPLTSIIGSIDLIPALYSDEIQGKVKDLVGMTDRNSHRLQELINKVIDISKTETDEYPINLEDIDIIPLLNEYYEKEVTESAKKASIKCNYYTHNITQANVNTDIKIVKTIIRYLVNNAVKFSKPYTNIDMDIKIVNDKLKISIINYGAYIPEEKQHKLFQKFALVGSTKNKKEEGTGLGLYLAKQLVEKINADIGFESNMEKTEFYIDITLL